MTTKAELASLPADASLQCPECLYPWPWLSDQGQCIQLHDKCLSCLLAEERPEEEADELVRLVIEARENIERQHGRRVFPCPFGPHPGCKRCGDRGWILGYPPGYVPPVNG